MVPLPSVVSALLLLSSNVGGVDAAKDGINFLIKRTGWPALTHSTDSQQYFLYFCVRFFILVLHCSQVQLYPRSLDTFRKMSLFLFTESSLLWTSHILMSLMSLAVSTALLHLHGHVCSRSIASYSSARLHKIHWSFLNNARKSSHSIGSKQL